MKKKLSTTEFIRKREKGSPPEGEVPTDDYIQQMFTGTPPSDRTPSPGLLPPELRQAIDVPLDLANTFIRGAAGAVAGPAYGVYKGVTSDKFGTPEGVAEASSEAGRMMQKITGTPKTQTGRDVMEFIGEKAEALKLAPTPQLLTAPLPGPGSASALLRNYELAETPPEGVIKLPGGNYLAGQVEKAIAPLKSQVITPEGMVTTLRRLGVSEEDIPARIDNYERNDPGRALNKWIDSKLTKYVKNDMATERDPLRLQADKWATEQQPKLLAEKDAQIAKAQADMEKAQRERGVEPEVLTRSRARILELEKEREFIAARTGLHYVPRQTPELYQWVVDSARQNQGFPGTAVARSEAGKLWEDLSDRFLANRSTAEEVTAPNYFLRDTDAQRIMAENPWLSQVPPETQVRFLNSGLNQQDTGFKHMADELRNALNPNSGLPPNLQISTKDLEKMTVPQAADLVDRINAHRAVQKIEADKLAAQKSIEVYKEYPETEQGLRWVEVKLLENPDTQLPENWTVKQDRLGGKDVFYVVNDKGENVVKGAGFDVQDSPEQAIALARKELSKKELTEALKYEGDIMQHCVGGYCPDVISGESRIFSLRDSTGKPHATVEVAPDPIRTWDDVSNVVGTEEATRLWTEFDATSGSRIKNKDDAFLRFIEEKGLQTPAKIKQIKGVRNQKPVDEYIPFVQDFVKSQRWSSVGDINNTGLIDLRDTSRALNALGTTDLGELRRLKKVFKGDYITPEELSQFRSTPGYAAGGEVTKCEVSTTDFIRKREKGSPPEGEVTNDEYIQQMFTGTPPANRTTNPGILPPELRQAVDVPLDFLNLLVRGGAGAVAGPAYGLYKGITSDKFGTPEGVQEAGTEAGKMMSKITGTPKTQTARDTLEFIGGVAEEAKVPPMPQFLTTRAPGPGSARALMRSYETAETPPMGAINVPGAKATRIFEEIPTTKTTATQYGAEFVQSPFVGRLDKMIAELPGPVQKEQFLNQLKGKFRDYEIGRAKEALKDLSDNAKITPFDLLNKIKEDFDPSRYGTSIVKPDPNNPDKFYASMDNIYKAPLGVIHLRQLATPEAEAGISRAKDMYQALKTKTHSGINSDLSTPEVFNNYKANVNEFLRDLNQPERSVEANRLLDTAQSSVSLYERVSDAVNSINYPTLSSVYKTLQAEQKALSKPFDWNTAIRMATQSGIDELDNIFPGTKVKLYDDIQALLTMDPTLRTKAASNVKDAMEPTQNAVREAFRQSMSGLRELLEKTYNNPKSPMAQFGYQGQHAGLGRTPTQTGIPNEIAFSRYSEHTTDVPDLGKVDGIYVHELQSDRLDDIRKKGPLGGSPTKDLPKAAELGKKLQNLTEQAAIENQRYLDNPTTEQKQKLTELQEQQKRTQEQLNKWMKRISEGEYKIKESFVGMEESPQVIQQLMAKNVIAAAIQMGKNFVAFPGAESSQAQLYEKLPNNLKQVVKDLGPGFEYRPITLTTPDGQDVMHPGVVWDKYGAGRVGAEGVPFKKGGEVRTEDFIKKVLK